MAKNNTSAMLSATILSVLAYSLCSGTMVLLNKLILSYFPYPSLVVSFQLLFALVFIFSAQGTGLLQVDPLKWECIIPYLFYIFLFNLGVSCYMQSLKVSNVETIMVFRAVSPCIVAFLDALFLGREYPSMRSWAAMSIIVFGAYGYASFDEKFQLQGLEACFWPVLYLAVISLNMAYGKKIITSVNLKTLSGPVLYTNLLELAPMLVFAARGGEYHQVYEDRLANMDTTIPVVAWIFVLLGCVAGTGTGYAGWWCRGNVSATSFTVIGVINKCLAIFLNVLVWDKHAPPPGIACLVLCLIGGTLYQQAPMREVIELTEVDPSADSDELEKRLLKAEDGKLRR